MMLQPPPAFATFQPSPPDEQVVRAAYAGMLQAARAPGPDVAGIVDRWETLHRGVDTWAAWVHLRYQQDTRDPDRRADRDRGDSIVALLKELDADLKRTLLEPENAAATESAIGPTAAALWSTDHRAFAPAVSADYIAEQTLAADYTALKASAEIEFEGSTYSLVTIGKPCLDDDRERRHAAQAARWGWFADNSEPLDSIFDQLVGLRVKQARALGLKDYTELGYLRMQRVDYDRTDVERFRSEIRRLVVPLVARLRAAQASRLQVAPLMFWDEQIRDLKGTPLLCGADGLADAGRAGFDRLDPDLAAFYRMMVDGGWVDLGSRPGKAGGGFCTWMADARAPFVYCAGNGTHTDVRTLVHEIGHAFQAWSSRDMKLQDLVFPTYEAAEIHSMGLEFLAWPTLDVYFGEATDRWRRGHLEQALGFLPYGTAVDHFQHLVYENPSASPADRNAMWQEMEATYLPWRRYGDLPHLNEGGFWQFQRHIYARPFYYIDYCLAQTCALQLWAKSQTDHAGTMRTYKELCSLGGSLPFQALCDEAGLRSPLSPGCLDEVVASAEAWLGK
jgi:M3 family oligoendopeptidase